MTGPERSAERNRERVPWDVVAVIALGGAIGGTARWLLNEVVPPSRTGFPWSTFLENVIGAFLLGALIVFLLEVWRPGRYRRPFLGVGVLGGFTTFSTFTNDVRALLMTGDALVAATYVAGTLAAGLAAVDAGQAVARVVALRATTREAER